MIFDTDLGNHFGLRDTYIISIWEGTFTFNLVAGISFLTNIEIPPDGLAQFSLIR